MKATAGSPIVIHQTDCSRHQDLNTRVGWVGRRVWGICLLIVSLVISQFCFLVCVGGKVWGKVVVQDVVNVGNNWEPRRCEGLFEHKAAY